MQVFSVESFNGEILAGACSGYCSPTTGHCSGVYTPSCRGHCEGGWCKTSNCPVSYITP